MMFTRLFLGEPKLTCRPSSKMLRFFNFLVGLCFAIASTPASAITSHSHKLFNVNSQVLENGLHVISHFRDTSDKLSLQMVVNVGLADFPCDKHQVPHVLEHLLFDGTESFDGEFMRKRIKSLGGDWHGRTVEEYTHYTIEIHAHHAAVAFETMQSMLMEPLLKAESLDKSIRIIHSELGTSDSKFKQLVHSELALSESTRARLYPESNLDCTSKSFPDAVTLADVTQTYNAYYNASNMTLIIIGNFDQDNLDSLLETYISPIKKGQLIQSNIDLDQPINYEPIELKSNYWESDAYIRMLIRTVGNDHPDSIGLKLISDFLEERLFYEVRTKRGIGYTPYLERTIGTRYGHIHAVSKTNGGWYKATVDAFESVYQKIRKEGIPIEDINRLKQKQILDFESEEHKHSGIAQIYRHHRESIKETGNMLNLVAEINKITPELTEQLIQKYFPPKPLIGVYRPPSLAENLVKILGIIALSAIVALPILRRKRRHK